jgi:hypothetical protein
MSIKESITDLIESITDLMYDVFYWIDSFKAIDKVVGTVQIFATISAFLYSSYVNTQKDKALLYSSLFFICQIILLSFYFVSVMISGKYLPIKLRLNRITGALYDSTTRFINIALREESLNIILKKIDDSQKILDLGKEVGENFYKVFDKNLLISRSYKKDEKLKKWLEYDSSSGMGKFDLIEHSDAITIIEVTSPLIENCPKNCCTKPTNGCCFLKGYVEGVSSKLLDQNLNSDCEPKNDPPRCIFTLKPTKTC